MHPLLPEPLQEACVFMVCVPSAEMVEGSASRGPTVLVVGSGCRSFHAPEEEENYFWQDGSNFESNEYSSKKEAAIK